MVLRPKPTSPFPSFGLLVFLALSVISPSFAGDEGAVWIALPDTTPSCTPEGEKAPPEREARLREEERQLRAVRLRAEHLGASVETARRGRLKGRRFCASCDCPSGFYHLLLLRSLPQDFFARAGGGWERIRPEEIWLRVEELPSN